MTPPAPTNLRDSLALDEGRVPYAYRDSLGFWTVGVGRLIDKRKGARLPADILAQLDRPVQQAFANLDQLPLNVTKWPAARLPEILIDELLDRDIVSHRKLLRLAAPWVESLSSVRQDCVDNMAFNLGTGPFDPRSPKHWPKFCAQVRAGEYAAAAANMRSTLWAKQVGKRAQRLAFMMENDQWPDRKLQSHLF